MHPLLARQLQRLGLREDAPPDPEQWARLLARVSRAYADADQDRYTLERSLMISSREMQALYEDLRSSSEAALSAKNAELRRSLALAEALRESVLDGLLVVDGEARVVAYNRRFVELWDVPAATLADRDDDALIGAVLSAVVDPDAFVRRVRQLYEHPHEVAHDEVRLRDGRIFDRFSGPVQADGVHLGRIWCFRDVTERRRLEQERLVVSERMAALGSLLASVAHEINNPLTYVLGNLGFVGDALPPESEACTALEDALDGVVRIRRIVGDLRLLSRPQQEEVQRVDLCAVVEAAAQMAAHTVRHMARLELRHEAGGAVRADAVRLGQVFLNLLVNAAQALEAGRARHNAITVTTSTGGGWIRVEVADTGPGIRPEHLERIFDPFFTTKAAGAGSGLGLSICKGIVESYGGRIHAANGPAGGAVFAVELPLAPEGGEALPGEASLVPAARPARILVVDDEAEICSTVRRTLGCVHDVVACESARSALDLLARDESFDVILCDLMMPDLTGMDLYGRVEGRQPHLAPRLLFMTGGVFTPQAEAFLHRIPRPVLHKPFTADELRRRVARLLAA